MNNDAIASKWLEVRAIFKKELQLGDGPLSICERAYWAGSVSTALLFKYAIVDSDGGEEMAAKMLAIVHEVNTYVGKMQAKSGMEDGDG